MKDLLDNQFKSVSHTSDGTEEAQEGRGNGNPRQAAAPAVARSARQVSRAFCKVFLRLVGRCGYRMSTDRRMGWPGIIPAATPPVIGHIEGDNLHVGFRDTANRYGLGQSDHSGKQTQTEYGPDPDASFGDVESRISAWAPD